MFFISCWYILGQHHRIVAWVAECKSLPQHWHISSKGNMNIPSTNSRKHTCFLFFFFNKYLVFFKYIFIFFSISRSSQENKKPIKAKFCCVRTSQWRRNRTEIKNSTIQSRQVDQRWRENSVFKLFFRFCFNIEHIRHAVTTLTSTPSVGSEVHEITSTNPVTPGPTRVLLKSATTQLGSSSSSSSSSAAAGTHMLGWDAFIMRPRTFQTFS